MSASQVSRLSFHSGEQTQTAATPIVQVIPPKGTNYKTKITTLVYTPAATVHNVIIMKAIAKTTLSAAAADGATSVTLTSVAFADQATVAANDYLIIKSDDNTYKSYLVSAVVGNVCTIPALDQASAAGATVWIMGAPADVYHTTLKTVASTRMLFQDQTAGIEESGFESIVSDVCYSRSGFGDPMLVYSANATNAGFLNMVAATYHRLPQN